MELLSMLAKGNKTLAVCLGVVILVGGYSLAVGFIMLAWWLFAVRTFNAPMIDPFAAIGIEMFLTPLVAYLIFGYDPEKSK